MSDPPMTPILQQFLAESRDVLLDIGEKLIRLETEAHDKPQLDELFRLVHTLKGNCGLFDFPEMARVLHAAEDVMSAVRSTQLEYSQTLADRLLDAMDFVSAQVEHIQAGDHLGATQVGTSTALADSLRQLMPAAAAVARATGMHAGASNQAHADDPARARWLALVPDALRRTWGARLQDDAPLLYVQYTPEAECFFKGEDPFFQARQTPGLAWCTVRAGAPWPPLAELDAYRCVLQFHMVTGATRAEIDEHFRYVAEQVTVVVLTQAMLKASLTGRTDDGIAKAVVHAQLAVLSLPDQVPWLPGRMQAVAATLANCFRSTGQDALLPALDAALLAALDQATAAPLRDWLALHATPRVTHVADAMDAPQTMGPAATLAPAAESAAPVEPLPSRRADDAAPLAKTLKVDQEKIDRLMNLIGEMVVAKNGLPYLADRAESVFGVRDLAREIKAQYAVINRIAEEMQNAILQVRMMPVSFVFQRFPRLVRDIARKLGKDVQLVLEGEETEADKNIIEALADPLIHIVRNSLDHGLELPDARRAAGKPPVGRLVIRAAQEADRVVIDIVDDGKGMDPAVLKRKAYEKGLIDESTLERITDAEAVHLVFAAGFSTAEVVSDLSGRGVGMDVVRAAVEQVNGTITLQSKVGEGTRLRLSLPLSMAVTNVMVVESGRQIFGVPMDMVVETVRIPRGSIHAIKNRQTAVLRGRVVPLRTLNELMASDCPQRPNADDELATLVIRTQGEQVGIVVDDFRQAVDIVLKPMGGILQGLAGYAGSALLGDGSVLMVLNPEELM